jgi:hypothetical protein
MVDRAHSRADLKQTFHQALRYRVDTKNLDYDRLECRTDGGRTSPHSPRQKLGRSFGSGARVRQIDEHSLVAKLLNEPLWIGIRLRLADDGEQLPVRRATWDPGTRQRRRNCGGALRCDHEFVDAAFDDDAARNFEQLHRLGCEALVERAIGSCHSEVFYFATCC